MSVVELNGAITPIRGRAVVPKYHYTFRSSGIRVECHKLSPTIFQAFVTAVRKECQAGQHPEHPFPDVPKQEVNIAGEIREEEVRGGDLLQAYQEQLAAWQRWANVEAGTRLMRMIALKYLIVDEAVVTEAVGFHREALQSAGAELPDLGMDPADYTAIDIDRAHYLFSICMLNQELDTREFLDFLYGRAQPREEAILDRIADFRAPA